MSTVSPLTEARRFLQSTLQSLGATIYPAPPENVTLPAAVVTPGDPWAKALTYGKTEVTLEVTLMATMAGSNAAAYDRLEALVWEATKALEGHAILGAARAPRVLTIGAAQVAAADLTIIIHTED
jgi:hypothetical protein